MSSSVLHWTKSAYINPVTLEIAGHTEKNHNLVPILTIIIQYAVLIAILWGSNCSRGLGKSVNNWISKDLLALITHLWFL